MNYSESLTFVFQDSDWVKKLAIGGFFALLSFYAGLFFIFGFFILGYYLAVIRNVLKNEQETLPDWSDLGQIFLDGLLGTIVVLPYILVIGIICGTNIAMTWNEPYISEAEAISITVFIAICTLVALAVFVNLALLLIAESDNFSAAFNFSRMLSFLRSQSGNFLAIIFFSTILNCILFFVGFGVLAPFTNFWGLLVQAHLFGQCLSAYKQESIAEQPV